MFVLANDGGILEEQDECLAAERTVCQREFVHDIISSGIAVILLRGCEFRDTKVIF